MKKFLVLVIALLITQTVLLRAGDDRIWAVKTHYHISVEFSPNSNLILSHGRGGGSDSRIGVIIFNTAGDTIKQIYNSDGLQFVLGQGMWDAHFSQDGRYLVVIWEYEKDNMSKGMLEIFETENWTSVKKIEIPGDAFSLLGSSVLMSPDNNTIVGTTQEGFYFYNAKSGELIKHVPIIADNKYVMPVYSVYSKDGSHIYFTSSDGKLRFLNTQTFETDYTYHAGYGYLAISKDGSMIAFKTGLKDLAVHVMEIDTKEIIQSIPGIVQAVSGIGFSNDNKYLGVAFQNQAILNIYIITTGEIVKNLLGTSYGTLSYSYDDKYIITDVGSLLILLPNTTTSVSQERRDFGNFLYPNPANNSINVEFNLNKSGYTKIQLYDLSGRIVKNIDYQFLEAGNHNLEIDISNIPIGQYNLTIETFTGIKSHKILVSR